MISQQQTACLYLPDTAQRADEPNESSPRVPAELHAGRRPLDRPGRTGGYAALRMNLPATSRTAREKGQQAVSRPSWSSGHVTAVRRRSGAEHAVIDRATAAHAGHLVVDGPGRGWALEA